MIKNSGPITASLLLTFFLMLICTPILKAQSGDDLKHRDFRFTILPGVGTNGVNSLDYSARFSLNVLGGYHGALDGYEIGFFNINQYYTRGYQAGFFNASGGSMSGVNIGGVNYSRRDMGGVQLSAIANVSEQDIGGIQASGFVNSSYGSIQGVQFAGLGNVSRDAMRGIQVSGVFNIVADDGRGLMVAGFGNFNTGRSQGITISGVSNIARDVQGLSFAGFLNATRRMQGFQFSGFANVANRVQGGQIGIVNFAREFEGIPIGLISYYGDGRKNIDVWMSDGGFQNVGIKLGTTSVYNMASIGYNPFITGRDVWTLGWTVGSYKPLEEAWEDERFEGFFRKRDISIINVQEGSFSTRINTIYRFRYLLGRDIGNEFGVYAGPTLNFLLSRDSRSNEYAWYSIFRGERDGSDFAFWAGFTVGMQIFSH